MNRSSERILTTHAGSLPQPDDLREMLTAKNTGLTIAVLHMEHPVANDIKGEEQWWRR
jgi:hypothetical protein